MTTQLVTHTVASLPSAVDVPAAVLAAVKTLYPAAATAHPYGELVSIEPAPGGGKTNLVVRVTFPSDRLY